MNNNTSPQNEDNTVQQKRTLRVFVSSTFKDMIEDRNELMTHTWPQLRQFCRERQVELVEVDLRWGIAEEQSTRKETLKLCLDEIRACRPFFLGLLGERYGWVPDDDAYTADLKEEQPWLKDLHGKSVTELEIFHGVLNNPEMAGRSFFYFRDPAYAQERGTDFLPENEDAAEKLTTLKNIIRTTCKEKNIQLKETYSNPGELAALVLEQLKAAIESLFPKESIPDPLTREARDHEAFAEIRRRTYIERSEYYEALKRYVEGDEKPLLLLGESGSGKSALIANWVEHWRKAHPDDFIFQQYIGGTADSAVHWKLMIRLMAEVKRWTKDPDDLPKSNDDMLRDFPLWLSKARIKAGRDEVRFVVVLDALNQLEDKDNGRLLGWLPTEPFRDNLRLIVSTLPGITLEVLEKRSLVLLHIEPLTPDECARMIVEYLGRFGKALDKPRIERLSNTIAAANPLYLKILLDELRVTGTHDELDERLDDYLKAQDIPKLLQKVLTRYKQDYEQDRKGLVSEALGLLWSARRGLTESELLHLLRPDNLPQLPLATWTPLRAALEESLVDRGGILNFAHDFLRTAVETAYAPDLDKQDDFRIQLADYFEILRPTSRTCDELPWLLWKTELFKRLRRCLLDIEHFLLIRDRDEDELRKYWIGMDEERKMGIAYLESYKNWFELIEKNDERKSYAAMSLGFFLFNASFNNGAEYLFKISLNIDEELFGKNHPDLVPSLNNLAVVYQAINRLDETEKMMKRALKLEEQKFGKDHPNVARSLHNLGSFYFEVKRISEAKSLLERALIINEEQLGENHPRVASSLNSLAVVYHGINRLDEAEQLYKRALKIDEQSYGKYHPRVAIRLNGLANLFHDINRLDEEEQLLERALEIDEECYGKDHPNVALRLGSIADLFQDTNRMIEAEPIIKRALKIEEKNYGIGHPRVAMVLNNLATLLYKTNRLTEAEQLLKRALKIDEQSYGENHPNVAIRLNNIAQIFNATNRLGEAEPLMKRALKIDEESFGKDHPKVAIRLNNIAQIFNATNRLGEAEPLMKRALKIDEESFGKDHPKVAISLNNLALFYQTTNRFVEAEPLLHRVVEIYLISFRSTGHVHPHWQAALDNYITLLQNIGWSGDKILVHIQKMAPEILNE